MEPTSDASSSRAGFKRSYTSSGSATVHLHLWASKCGYLPGPSLQCATAGFVEFADWLAKLDVQVHDFSSSTLPGPMSTPSQDEKDLPFLVRGVTSGSISRDLPIVRFPLIGELLFEMIFRDLAIIINCIAGLLICQSTTTNKRRLI